MGSSALEHQVVTPRSSVTTKCLNPKCGKGIAQPPCYPVGARFYCDATCSKQHQRAVDLACKQMDDEEPYPDETSKLFRHVQKGWGVGSKTFNK